MRPLGRRPRAALRAQFADETVVSRGTLTIGDHHAGAATEHQLGIGPVHRSAKCAAVAISWDEGLPDLTGPATDSPSSSSAAGFRAEDLDVRPARRDGRSNRPVSPICGLPDSPGQIQRAPTLGRHLNTSSLDHDSRLVALRPSSRALAHRQGSSTRIRPHQPQPHGSKLYGALAD